MFFKIRFVFLCLLGIIIASPQCVSDTDIDIPAEPLVLTVVAHPTPGSQIIANIGISNLVTNDTTLPPDFAPLVEISESDNPMVDVMRLIPGPNSLMAYWISGNIAGVGKEYSLSIKADGFPNLSATTTIPQASNPAMSVDKNAYPVSYEGDKTIKRIPLTINVKDISSTDSFFVFSLLFTKKNLIFNDMRESKPYYAAEAPVNAHLRGNPDNSILIEKEYWEKNTGTQITVEVIAEYMTGFEIPYEIQVEWRTVSKEYYLYYLSIARQGIGNIPFTTPDKFYNNINGGYGTFSGYNFIKKTIPLQ